MKTNLSQLSPCEYMANTSSLCTRYISVKALVKVSRCLTSVFEKWTSSCACWQLSAWTQGCQTAQHTLWASSLTGMRLRTQDLSKNLVSFVPFICKSWEPNKRTGLQELCLPQHLFCPDWGTIQTISCSLDKQRYISLLNLLGRSGCCVRCWCTQHEFYY